MTNTYDELHVERDGDPGAPALLLIHASGGWTREWDPLVPMLTGAHHVIRVDLLGYGRSAKPADGDYAVPAQARRVGAVLDRLGVERAVVAGHSSGGYTTTALAEARPELVTAVAVMNTGPSLESVISQDEKAILPTQWAHLTDAQLRQMAAVGFSRPGFQVPIEFLQGLRSMTFHTFTATMRESSAYIAEKPVPDRLAATGKPVLVIWGEADKRYRSPFSIAAYRGIPGAQVETLPGIGHTPNLEDPERTAELLLAFAAAYEA